MKIWFDYCSLYYYLNDCHVKLGIGWFKHHKDHKWWGLTIELYVIKRMISLTYVSNYKEYDKKINYRRPKK